MISPEQSGDIKKNNCGHKTELFLDKLGNQESDKLRDHKHDYIKGDSILCEKRFYPDTYYMVEMELLENDNRLGEKGNYIRKFLTEPEYFPILQKQEKHLIKIKRQAIVQKGNLRYIIPPPDRLDRRRERDIL